MFSILLPQEVKNFLASKNPLALWDPRLLYTPLPAKHVLLAFDTQRNPAKLRSLRKGKNWESVKYEIEVMEWKVFKTQDN